jgi:hypothetical protein
LIGKIVCVPLVGLAEIQLRKICFRSFQSALFPAVVRKLAAGAVVHNHIKSTPAYQIVKLPGLKILQGMAKLMKQIKTLLVIRPGSKHFPVNEQGVDDGIERPVCRLIALRHVKRQLDAQPVFITVSLKK